MWRTGLAVALTTALVVGVSYALLFEYPAPTAATTGVGAGFGAALSYALATWVRRRAASAE